MLWDLRGLLDFIFAAVKIRDMKFNPSQMQTWFRCPLEYKHRYVVNSQRTLIRNDRREMNEVVLDSLDQFQGFARGGCLPPAGQVTTMISELWIESKFSSKQASADLKKQAIQILEAYRKSIEQIPMAFPDSTPYFIGVGEFVDVPLGDVFESVISVRLASVTKNDAGKFRLVEYSMSDAPESAESLLADPLAGLKYLAAETFQKYRGHVIGYDMIHLPTMTVTAVPVERIALAPLKESLKLAAEVAEGLAESVKPPTAMDKFFKIFVKSSGAVPDERLAKPGTHCGRCDFKSICPFSAA